MSDWTRHRLAEESNRALWDEMACVHERAYEEIGILGEGGEVLDEVELRELGDVRGKTMLHLQCHIGTDSLAWARHGAIVTGVDFSSQAIRCAERLREGLGLDATFICANVYDLPTRLEATFDIVYTSRGVLCWLSDLEEWGRIVGRFLKSGGVFYLLESHPILNALEEESPGVISFVSSYFHRREPAVWEAGGPDYADPTHALQHPSHEWDWTVGDIVNSLVDAGLRIESLNEHEYEFHRRFPSMESVGRRFRLPGYEGKLPLLLSLRARKP
jgi:SAM-dependent methyltransferase